MFVSFEPTKNYDAKEFTSASGKFQIYAQYQDEITIGDTAKEDPVNLCYNPALIAYVEPAPVSCDVDPNQDICIAKEKTCEEVVN